MAGDLTEQDVLRLRIKGAKEFGQGTSPGTDTPSTEYVAPATKKTWPNFDKEVQDFVKAADNIEHEYQAWNKRTSDEQAGVDPSRANVETVVIAVFTYIKTVIGRTQRGDFTFGRQKKLIDGGGAARLVAKRKADFILYPKNADRAVQVLLECKSPFFYGNGLPHLVQEEGTRQGQQRGRTDQQDRADHVLEQIFDYLYWGKAKYGMITSGNVWWAVRRPTLTSLEVSPSISWDAEGDQTTVIAAILYIVHTATGDPADMTVPDSPMRTGVRGKGRNTGAKHEGAAAKSWQAPGGGAEQPQERAKRLTG